MGKKYFAISFLMLWSLQPVAQQCGNCKQTPKVAGYDLDVQVPQPKLNGTDSTGWLEWLRLFWVNKFAHGALFQNNKNCVRFIQPESSEGVLKVGETYTNLPEGNISEFGDYYTTGYVKQQGDGYVMHIELQASCSRKVVAAATVQFQLLTSGQMAQNIGQQAASQLTPLIDKIRKFELQERENNKYVALATLGDDDIIIIPKKRNLAQGEQTELDITLKDCDGKVLPNREILFGAGSISGMAITGTLGGTVTPSNVTTDANGKAKATFKMGADRSAVINAHHLFNLPTGCPYAKVGSTPIGTIPVKVELDYYQNESKTTKRITLPGIKIKGGNETEETTMFHNSVLYYYPTAEEIKKGMLVQADPEAAANTKYVLESGYYRWSKNIQDAQIIGMAGKVEMVQGEEKGSQEKMEGYATLEHPSEVDFFMGDANNPPSFMWNVQYPGTDPDQIVGGGASITKGDEGVEWNVKKITDPNSPYKTEYLLKLKLNAAEELQKGNKAMKDMFGFDLDKLTGIIDPTNPQANVAGAAGSQTITVRILSPYPAE